MFCSLTTLLCFAFLFLSNRCVLWSCSELPSSGGKCGGGFICKQPQVEKALWVPQISGHQQSQHGAGFIGARGFHRPAAWRGTWQHYTDWGRYSFHLFFNSFYCLWFGVSTKLGYFLQDIQTLMRKSTSDLCICELISTWKMEFSLLLRLEPVLPDFWR